MIGKFRTQSTKVIDIKSNFMKLHENNIGCGIQVSVLILATFLVYGISQWTIISTVSG
jgi:hypothetical protein